jgi:hypothetical protein
MPNHCSALPVIHFGAAPVDAKCLDVETARHKRKCKTFREGKTVPSAVCNLVVAKVEEMGLFF